MLNIFRILSLANADAFIFRCSKKEPNISPVVPPTVTSTVFPWEISTVMNDGMPFCPNKRMRAELDGSYCWLMAGTCVVAHADNNKAAVAAIKYF